MRGTKTFEQGLQTTRDEKDFFLFTNLRLLAAAEVPCDLLGVAALLSILYATVPDILSRFNKVKQFTVVFSFHFCQINTKSKEI